MVERRYEDKYTTCMNFERAVYNKISEFLRVKGVSMPEEINRLLKQRLTELEKEQKIKEGIVIIDNSAVKSSEVIQNSNNWYNIVLESKRDSILDDLRTLPLDRREKLVSIIQTSYMQTINEEQIEEREDTLIGVSNTNNNPLNEEEYIIVQEYSHPSKKPTTEVIELRKRLRQYGKVG